MDLREKRAAALRRLNRRLLRPFRRFGALAGVAMLLGFARPAAPDRSACIAFNQLNDRIRDQAITRAAAQRQLTALLPQLAAYYAAYRPPAATTGEVFPLAGYTAAAIGGRHGNGYQPASYDYFAGNRHGGHPAHDIFIHDRDRDSRDDRTHQPVTVRALTGGVVVALSTSWQAGSSPRGGNYLWVYTPASRSLFYYAHNATVLVELGDVVQPGDALATVGRTGRNAQQARSPTHLHLMQLTFDARHRPLPVDCYARLRQARANP